MSDELQQVTRPTGRVVAAKKRLDQASDTFSLGRELIQLGKTTWTWYQERKTYGLTLGSDDPLYLLAHAWVLSLAPRRAQKHVAVRSQDDYGFTSPDEQGGDRKLAVTYDSETDLRIQVGEHRIKVSVDVAPPDAVKKGFATDKLNFRCDTLAARQAVVDQLEVFLSRQRLEDRQPQLRMLSSWGQWQRRADVPSRKLETVILPAGQLEALVADLESFFEQEPWYNRLGLPYHRGYLFEGPPGTGKTSLARALAHHLGLDLWYAPLNDLEKDTDLLGLVSEVRSRSILLLEDVDTLAAATEREGEGAHELSMSSLLNSLDGVSTPHGLVTILTTNHPEVLDEAVVRPGRIDRIEHVGYLTLEQARRLFHLVYDREPRGELRLPDTYTAAALLEVAKRHPRDAAAAEVELHAAYEAWVRADVQAPS